jgi:cyclophilin family peptidyl-prolyl cis-trans isomerase
MNHGWRVAEDVQVYVPGDKIPVYEETLEDLRRSNETPALPFNAYGTLAMARSEFDENSASSQVRRFPRGSKHDVVPGSQSFALASPEGAFQAVFLAEARAPVSWFDALTPSSCLALCVSPLQVFFLLKESELTPSGANLLDGRYAVFGYVTENVDALGEMKVGDVVVSAKVISGLEFLENRSSGKPFLAPPADVIAPMLSGDA